ncbi:MAG: hypothetical protein JWN34_869 [Bryobacterales bacterium]|nr:hypothetical protein [Bryobacterales bacterium]
MTTTETTTRSLQLRTVLDGTFRANPGYELKPFNQLPAAQREMFAALRNDPEFYGVLMPRDGFRLPLKSACQATARLLTELEEAGRLPDFALTESLEVANRGIAELVLDGVLQIFHHGDFIHGPAAFDAVCETSSHVAAPAGTAQLSRDAIIYAQSLPFTDAAALSARLYSYGRLPVTPAWRRQFPDEDSIRRCLGVEAGGRNHARLAAGWNSLPPDPDNDGWLFWQSRIPSTGRRRDACKLYLSPHPSHLAEAFDALLHALQSSRANAFKVGKNLSGVLRADKVIVYFSHCDELQEAAAAILERLAGCPAHGVPFTAQLGAPLLSWGCDPQTANDAPPWLARQSWRLWITNRLAIALIAAKQQPQPWPTEPWQFAVDRLRLEGVDTDSWSPAPKG